MSGVALSCATVDSRVGNWPSSRSMERRVSGAVEKLCNCSSPRRVALTKLPPSTPPMKPTPKPAGIAVEAISQKSPSVHGSVKAAKEAGVFRLEGKEYVVQEGDIIEFRFSV